MTRTGGRRSRWPGPARRCARRSWRACGHRRPVRRQRRRGSANSASMTRCVNWSAAKRHAARRRALRHQPAEQRTIDLQRGLRDVVGARDLVPDAPAISAPDEGVHDAALDRVRVVQRLGSQRRRQVRHDPTGRPHVEQLCCSLADQLVVHGDSLPMGDRHVRTAAPRRSCGASQGRDVRRGRTYIASTLGMISSVRRLRSSSVLATGTPWNGGQRRGIVRPASR